jgi:hypothetical protein
LSHEEGRADIEIKDCREVLAGHGADRLWTVCASIIDEDVEVRPSLQGPPHGDYIRYVQRQYMGSPASATNCRRNLFDLRGRSGS